MYLSAQGEGFRSVLSREDMMEIRVGGGTNVELRDKGKMMKC